MLNEAKLIGHLGNEPDSRYMPNGGRVVTLSLATTRQWKNRDSGEREEHTEWHRVVMYGKLAEICAEYLHKGSQVYIGGRIETKKWSKDGVDRYSTQIVADTMKMLGNKQGGSNTNPSPQANQQAPNNTNPEDFDDDIPF